MSEFLSRNLMTALSPPFPPRWWQVSAAQETKQCWLLGFEHCGDMHYFISDKISKNFSFFRALLNTINWKWFCSVDHSMILILIHCHNWSKPQWIQAIGVRVVINFYTREERSDRARWRLGPLAEGSWDLSQAIIDPNHSLFTCSVGCCSIDQMSDLFSWPLFNQ